MDGLWYVCHGTRGLTSRSRSASSCARGAEASGASAEAGTSAGGATGAAVPFPCHSSASCAGAPPAPAKRWYSRRSGSGAPAAAQGTRRSATSERVDAEAAADGNDAFDSTRWSSTQRRAAPAPSVTIVKSSRSSAAHAMLQTRRTDA